MMPADFARRLHVTPTGPRALLVAGGEAAILRWPWPLVTHVRESRVPAKWLAPRYPRPIWGHVPPEIATPPDPDPDPDALIERRPRTQQQQQQGRVAPPSPEPGEPGERVSPRVDASAAAAQGQAQREHEGGEKREKREDIAAAAAVTDPIAGALLDALLPGAGSLGDIVDLARDVGSSSSPPVGARAPGVISPTQPYIGSDAGSDTEEEWENER